MDIKYHVMVKNKFTNQYHSGYGNTPGKFVVDYIAREGATENLAPVGVAPTQRLADYVNRYQSRNELTQDAIEAYAPKQELQHELNQMDDLDGRSFGNLGLSYTKDQLMSQAAHVQSLFDAGHTVEKLVVSFTDTYLRDRGVVPKSFHHYLRGDFAGQVDQLKLRSAVNDGMKQLSIDGKYQNPLWMGAIQVDTNHLHVHAILCDDIDRSQSRRLGVYDGQVEERGKLTAHEKDSLRYGIDDGLLQYRPMHQYHAQVDLGQEDEQSNIQHLVQDQFGSNVQIQLILASLPRDQSLWDADSDDPVMRRPNELMDSYLNDLTNQYDDQLHYRETLDQLRVDAHRQSFKDTQSDRNFTQYFSQSVQLLRNQMKNSIYQQLGNVIESTPASLSTPYLVENARDPEALKMQIQFAYQHPNQVQNLDMTLFAYRLTSYRQRLSEHLDKFKSASNNRQQFDEQALQNKVSPESFAMRQYYATDALFHAQAVDKYRYFFKIDGHDDVQTIQSQQSQLDVLSSQRKSILQRGKWDGLWQLDKESGLERQTFRRQSAQQLLQDPRARNVLNQPVLESDDAQVRVIGQALIKAARDTTYELPESAVMSLDQLGTQLSQYRQMGTRMQAPTGTTGGVPSPALTIMMQSYVSDLDTFTHRNFIDGVLRADQLQSSYSLMRQFNQEPTINNIPQVPNLYPRELNLSNRYFNTVKGIDLHDVGYDFGPNEDRMVDAMARDTYSRGVQMRRQALQGVVRYLQGTHQEQLIPAFKEPIEASAQQRKLNQVIQEQHQLPFTVLDQQDMSYDNQRQFKSFDLNQANHITRQQLSLLRDIDTQVQQSRQVVQNPVPTSTPSRQDSNKQSPS